MIPFFNEGGKQRAQKRKRSEKRNLAGSNV